MTDDQQLTEQQWREVFTLMRLVDRDYERDLQAAYLEGAADAIEAINQL